MGYVEHTSSESLCLTTFEWRSRTLQRSARQKRGLAGVPAVRTDPKVGFENSFILAGCSEFDLLGIIVQKKRTELRLTNLWDLFGDLAVTPQFDTQITFNINADTKTALTGLCRGAFKIRPKDSLGITKIRKRFGNAILFMEIWRKYMKMTLQEKLEDKYLFGLWFLLGPTLLYQVIAEEGSLSWLPAMVAPVIVGLLALPLREYDKETRYNLTISTLLMVIIQCVVIVIIQMFCSFTDKQRESLIFSIIPWCAEVAIMFFAEYFYNRKHKD